MLKNQPTCTSGILTQIMFQEVYLLPMEAGWYLYQAMRTRELASQPVNKDDRNKAFQKKKVVLPSLCQNMGQPVGNLLLFFLFLNPLWADISQF